MFVNRVFAKCCGPNAGSLEFSGNFGLCVNNARISSPVISTQKMKIAAEQYFYQTIC